MEREYGQSKYRLSRFVQAATKHVSSTFEHTLEFDKVRIQRDIHLYSTAIGVRLAIADPQANRCWGFIDGTFRYVARPVRHQETLYNGHYGGHGYKYQVR